VPELRIHDDDAGQRLDRFLRKLLPNAPLGLLHRLVRQGAVRVDGERASGSTRLAAGQVVRLALADERFAELAADDEPRPIAGGELAIVHRDPHILVIDKPGGLALHGGTGIGDDHLMARVAAMLGHGDARTFRPAPAHRIDRATSGLVVIGTSAEGLRGMAALFRSRSVDKTYFAVVEGRPVPPSGRVDVPLAIADRGVGGRKSAPDDAGVPARTGYRTRSRHGALTLLEVDIDTGRTHQIRAHLATLGTPVVGDRRYGATRSKWRSARIALHAHRLRFTHPVDGRALDLVAPLPADIAVLL
jgi:23S rRNA pseudouridine955/2504/2580 synthase